MNKNNKGFTVIEIMTSFTIASVIMVVLFNIVLIIKDNLEIINIKTDMLVEKDNLSYNINKRFKEKEISGITTCEDKDKCYEFTYSDDTSDKLVYSIENKTITFNNYTFDIIDGINVEEPTITEHYDTMSSTTYNGYFIINIPIKLDNKDYSIKINKYFNTSSVMVDLYEYDNNENMYTKVNYLESTGTQYIDTEYKANTNTSVEFEIDTPNIICQACFLFASRDSDYYTNGFGIYYANNYIARFSSSTNYSSNIAFSENAKLHIILNKERFSINDSSILISGGTIQSINNLYIFAANTGGSVSAKSGYRLIFFKIYDNNTLVRDYIPVIDSSERPCLFDKVEKKCYYNQGTGEFLYG